MFGPEAFQNRQRKDKDAEQKAKSDAKLRWSKPHFSGGIKSRNEVDKDSVNQAEKTARSNMRKPKFMGGWERKSLHHPLIRNKEKTEASEKSTKSTFTRAKFSGADVKWKNLSQKNLDDEKKARDAATKAMRKPAYGGGWERRSLFHPQSKNKARDNKAKADAKAAHRKPLFSGEDIPTAQARTRERERNKLLKRISRRVSRVMGKTETLEVEENSSAEPEATGKEEEEGEAPGDESVVAAGAIGDSSLSGTSADQDDSGSADVCIIGGGFSGAYAAYQLTKLHPSVKIIMLEKESFCGGRLLSDDNDEDNQVNKDELGGMRIFPSFHGEVADLITQVGCSMVPVALKDETNLFLMDGAKSLKADVKVNGRTMSEIVSGCLAAYAEALPNDAAMDPMESPELRSLSLPEFFLKYGATQEEVDAYFTYSGYDIFSDPDVQASIFVKEGKLYGSKLGNEQKYVKEGYQEVVKRMIDQSNAQVRFGWEAISIEENGTGALKVLCIDSSGKERTISAGQVVCGLPQDGVVKLLQQASPIGESRRAAVEDAAKFIPLFKCFVEWAPNSDGVQWWHEAGFECGKSTTDLPIRQLHYYDAEDLLVYCSGEYADYWNDKFSANPDAAAREIVAHIRELHADEEVPDPVWDQTIFKYWLNGSHKWTKHTDVPETMALIADGSADGSNIFVVGDAFSRHQGWTMGCVETVDSVLPKLSQAL